MDIYGITLIFIKEGYSAFILGRRQGEGTGQEYKGHIHNVLGGTLNGGFAILSSCFPIYM